MMRVRIFEELKSHPPKHVPSGATRARKTKHVVKNLPTGITDRKQKQADDY